MTGIACCRNCLHMISRGSLEMDRGVLRRRTVHVCAVKRITLDDVGSDRICSRFEEASERWGSSRMRSTNTWTNTNSPTPNQLSRHAGGS